MTDFAGVIKDRLYEELVERARFDARIANFGDFQHYLLGEGTGRFSESGAECFTLAVNNMLQGLVVVSRSFVLANVAATSTRVIRNHATTGGEEFAVLETGVLGAMNAFALQDEQLEWTNVDIVPLKKAGLVDDGFEFAGEEEVLYIGGYSNHPQWIGMNRRDDMNAMHVTIMPACGNISLDIADIARDYGRI